MSDLPGKKFVIPFAIIFSGFCWWLSIDLSGAFGWLIWIAPIPILYLCFLVRTGRQAFAIAFLSFFIGRLSWFSYLFMVLPLPLVIIYTLFFPLVFALIMLPVRRIVRQRAIWPAALAFPVFWTAFEYLTFLFAGDGTIASLATTQTNFLPLIQIASVTGILGISFLLSMVPSVIAVFIYFHRHRRDSGNGFLIPVTIIVMIFVIGGGLIRMSMIRNAQVVNERSRNLPIGMVTIDESAYQNVYDPNAAHEWRIAQQYLHTINELAVSGFGPVAGPGADPLSTGARVILLPEKAIPLTDTTETPILHAFADAAAALKITLIVGLTRIYKDHLENRSLVIASDGRQIADYQKVNLFEGERFDKVLPGHAICLFELDGVASGTAICKDMDYDGFIRQYGARHVSVLYAPAWDFTRDGWLHARVAILRSVENGFYLVRNARQGRLTISDPCGRILLEGNCENKLGAATAGKIGPAASRTLYSQWGNWFGMLNLIAAGGLLIMAFIIALRKKRAHSPNISSTVS
jgi:apolipoprotein N-acyltransferase